MFRYPYNKIFQGLNIIKNAGGGWQLKGKKEDGEVLNIWPSFLN